MYKRQVLDLRVAPNERRRRRAAATRRKQRAATEAALREGRQSDDAERWAVECVVAAERRGRKVFAKVAWAGSDEDGDPWEDSWLHISLLTADLRRETQSFLAAARQKTRPLPAIAKVGARRSPRLAGADERHRKEQKDRRAAAWAALHEIVKEARRSARMRAEAENRDSAENARKSRSQTRK